MSPVVGSFLSQSLRRMRIITMWTSYRIRLEIILFISTGLTAQFRTPPSGGYNFKLPPYIWHLYTTALSIPRHCNSEQCDLLTSLINLDLLPFRGFAKDTAIVKQTEESKLAKSAGGKSGKEYSATTTKTVTKSAAKSSAGEHSKVINNRLQGDR